ncbi:IPT/TIG domain-containing protein [Muricauda brasiliensis]|uniref:IPT/TIG domain-containing protein n=1 Tax=Muricauda brasiliensis TaxID=2162892 RepID=UPI000D3BFE34|nr:IPT/TIG domain-containing protein [Muricauda brasiliensis]
MKKVLLQASLAFSIFIVALACSKDDAPAPIPAPSITNFTPSSGKVGTNVTINGKNFGNTKTNNTVKFGNIAAEITTVSTTKLVVTVPVGAITGKISVTANGDTAISTSTFTVEEDAPVLALNKTALELYTLDNEILVASGNGGATINWTSSNPEVAMVDANGKVTAMGAGNATITATVGSQSVNAVATIVPNVYIGGYESNGTNNVAAIWKNGTKQGLSTSSDNSQVNSLFVVGADTYAAGNDGNVAMVWKNGEELYQLTNGANGARANGIFVEGSDVYAVGEESVDGFFVAKVWKNGNLLKNVTNGVTNAYGKSIHVDGIDIYVAGHESNGELNEARVWKNFQVLHDLSDGSNPAEAYSMVWDGTDVYTVGTEVEEGKFKAQIWKNNVLAKELTDGSNNGYAQSVFVDGDNVYVAGNDGIAPKIWKNGEVLYQHPDGGNYTEANAIHTNIGNVYASGFAALGGKNVVKLWKNDEEMTITDGSQDAKSFDLIVQ